MDALVQRDCLDLGRILGLRTFEPQKGRSCDSRFQVRKLFSLLTAPREFLILNTQKKISFYSIFFFSLCTLNPQRKVNDFSFFSHPLRLLHLLFIDFHFIPSLNFKSFGFGLPPQLSFTTDEYPQYNEYSSTARVPGSSESEFWNPGRGGHMIPGSTVY